LLLLLAEGGQISYSYQASHRTSDKTSISTNLDETLGNSEQLLVTAYLPLNTGNSNLPFPSSTRKQSRPQYSSFVPKPWDYESMRRVLERAQLFARTKHSRRRATDGERRAAPRHTVRLGARVLVLATGEEDEGEEDGGEGGTTHAMSAHTYDVSESGVALLIPAQEIAALDALGRGYVLRFMLGLPAGAVELTVRPVRREWLGGEEYLVGAEIVDMAGRDRVIYMEYVRGLAGE
jgi:hypothetical protein